MKLEEGMYVRTKDGLIRKCVTVDLEDTDAYELDDYIYVEYGDEINWLDEAELEKYISKSSYNIIDLIEEGDILLIKDFVDEACMIFNDMYYIQNENQLFNIKRDLEKNKNMKISKILTKEQYENNCYKVEE